MAVPGAVQGEATSVFLANCSPFEGYRQIKACLVTDDYVPFEPQAGGQAPKAFQLPWMASAKDITLGQLSADTPIIIKDSLTTKPPRFRTADAAGSDLRNIVSTMKACLHVGRFERAAALMQRLNVLYKTDSPELLAIHNDYIRESASKIASTRDQQLLRNLQKWFEVELRGRGIVPNATTCAFMILAVLQDISIGKSNRSIRRYLHLADQGGFRDHLMNELLTVLNEQDFGRVTRISTPEPVLPTLPTAPEERVTTRLSQPNRARSELPEVRPVDRNLAGWRALKQSLSIFSEPTDTQILDSAESTAEDKAKRLDIERQLRMEQDTYESAIERWRKDYEHLKKMGINSVLNHNSFGALMWTWHGLLEPAVREEIRLANEAESKDVRSKLDDERCQYGPFLQYLDPGKLSAITILSVMTLLGTARSGDLGCSIATLVVQIGDAVQDESVAEYLKSNRAHSGILRAVTNASSLRKIASGLKQRNDITAQVLEGHMWSSAVKARTGAVLLSKLIESAKLRVFRKDPETGSLLESSQPAFLHRSVYAKGRRIGMLTLNTSMADHLAKDPVAASLAQKYLPMVIEPKAWVSFREGGFLTSTESLVRVPQQDEQSRCYITVAMDNGHMSQVTAGLDVLSRTPWQINGPVLETMLEVWNSGQGIGNIAPDNPHMELPPEPAREDKPAHFKWLRAVRTIGNQKSSCRSERCFQNFQLEIARAYLNETFYFPHNVDFRGRAYPMSPFLNYMGADICRGLLTFGVGKPLGPTGLRWLKIHLANVFGFDKASFEGRVAFTDGHLKEISDSARKPLDGQRWWLEAEDPWQCLAACKELRNALDSPDPQLFESKLAIHQDGTCNGLQHYAALGGDSIGARQVNLEPGDRPSDIYTGVAELVQEDIEKDAQQGHKLARSLQGKITRKVVKPTVMTNVYGVTFMGAKEQVAKQLEELYPDFPKTPSVDYHLAALYIARKIFQALANMFNGAHDIQYWLGDCATRIATAVTPEQMQRVEATLAGALDEGDKYNRSPIRGRKGERGHRTELLAFKQSVIWTTPLKMPVVQPYRQKTAEKVDTHLQAISLQNRSMADPVDRRKQLQAFPPNFIHSLDATHMFLSALQCEKQGLTFTAVHDSFWTHASEVETMNHVLRDAFIKMHSEDIMGRLRSEFVIRYKDCMYMAGVKAPSPVSKKISQWRGKFSLLRSGAKPLESAQIDELILERRRLKLLASENPEERREGEEMVTPYSIFEQSDGEADLAVEESITEAALGNISAARENKLQANERLTVGDEDNIGSANTAPDEEGGVLDQHGSEESLADSAEPSDSIVKPKKRRQAARRTWLWRPLSFPPVPKKVRYPPDLV
ncbi:MAG: hypothetical protein LQ346_000924 [Caloplaca aetnensis]|nr:MAG: hypothetical protein LQ346_000924 [Caloplaca aetnensis]